MDDLKGLLAEHLAEHSGKAAADQNRACCYFTNVVRPAVVKKLEEAGFKKTSGYFSHRHAREVTFLMMRPTSKGEWADGKAVFPKKKTARKGK